MKRNLFVLTVLFLAGLVWAAPMEAQLSRKTTKVGSTVAQFLKIGAGARSLGMGGSAVAMMGDAYSVYWNPGALSRIPSFAEGTFTHAAWLADISYDFAAVALNLEGVGVLGLSVTSLGVPEDIVRTESNPYGDGRKWSASDLAIGISFARSLTDRFSIGVTGKYIRQAIWNESANGFAFDIGTLYITQFNDLKIGASISNFGTKMKLDGHDISFNDFPEGELGQGPQNIPAEYQMESYDIPLTFRIGVAMDAMKNDMFRATVSVDATHPNDNTEYLNTGLEVAYDEMAFARVGYKSLWLQDSEQGLTWGVGVNIGVSNITSVKLDYAFANYGRLENIQYLTLSILY